MLTLDALEYHFDDGTRVGPISLEAETGVVQLLGPNGSGKTTLMRVVGGVLPASAGSVSVRGMDPFDDAPARALIGAVSPDPELPGFLTTTEAWQHQAAFRGQPTWDGDSLVTALELPPHLRLDHMSSGQRRRAELIAALAGDPPILLLDETFTHLDDAGVAWLVEHLERARSQRLVVLSHHGRPPIEPDHRIELPKARRPAHT